MRAAHRPYLIAFFTLALSAVFTPACRGKGPPATTASADPSQLVIVKATWGALNEGVVTDVTRKIAGLVKGNALQVQASTKELGDPADLKLKQLRVQWSKGGGVGVKIVPEGETLSIGANEKPAPVRTVITKAVYGNQASGKVTDVTAKIADMVVDNVLSVTPTNALFGDPAAGQGKQLRVDYTFDGAARSKTVNENDSLTIAANGL